MKNPSKQNFNNCWRWMSLLHPCPHRNKEPMLSIQMLDIGHVIFIDENKFEKAEAFCAECPDFVQITLKLANSNEDLR